MQLSPRILIGIVLLVAGILAVVYGGFSYTSDEHTADLGPIQLSVEEKETVNIPLWAGIVAIAAGAVVLSVSTRR